MDFVHDQLATGGKFRILTVIDTYSRYARVVDPRPAYRGSDVVEMLERVCGQSGYPRVICVDQGSEFVSRDLEQRHARLLTAWQADRQRLHRGVQRPAARRMPEHALVLVAG